MPKKTKSFKKVEDKVARKLDLMGEDTNYAIVTKVLGGCRFMVKIHLENREVRAHLRGKFTKGSNKKNNTVQLNSVVLISMRDFDNNVDIVHVYNPDEVKQLKRMGEFVEESVRIGDDSGGVNEKEDMPFDFEEI